MMRKYPNGHFSPTENILNWMAAGPVLKWVKKKTLAIIASEMDWSSLKYMEKGQSLNSFRSDCTESVFHSLK